MDLAEALKVLEFDTLADPEKRRRHFRQLQFDLQQRADRGELNIDQAKLKTAMETLGAAIDGAEVPQAEISEAGETIRLALGPAPEAPPQPKAGAAAPRGWSSGEKAAAVAGGLVFAGLLGYAIGSSSRGSDDEV